MLNFHYHIKKEKNINNIFFWTTFLELRKLGNRGQWLFPFYIVLLPPNKQLFLNFPPSICFVAPRSVSPAAVGGSDGTLSPTSISADSPVAN